MQTILITIFWMTCILLAMYCWSGNISKDQDSVHNNNVPKIVVDFSSDTKQSTSSIESLEHSDNESTRRRKYMQKLQYEIKTRWPSATSIKD